MSVIEDVLIHYGKKGMKWGVRKESSTPTGVTVKVRGRKPLITKGGTGQPPHQDAIDAAVAKQKARMSGTHSLSTKEMQQMVTRMNLEQQYSKLSAHQKRKLRGSKFVTDIMSNIAKQQISAVGNAYVSKQVADFMAKQAKKKK